MYTIDLKTHILIIIEKNDAGRIPQASLVEKVFLCMVMGVFKVMDFLNNQLVAFL